MITPNKVLVLHGAGRLSEIVSKFVENKYDRIISYVNPKYIHKLLDQYSLPVVTSFQAELIKGQADYVSAIGYKNMRARKLAFCDLSRNHFLSPTNIIHSHAFVSPDAQMGVGNIVFPGVVVEDGVRIGDNNIFWSNSCVCHDSVIGSHNFFASSITIGGYSVIGESCFLGFGSIINEELEIADRTFLASGTVLTKSQLIPGTKMCGVPARIM